MTAPLYIIAGLVAALLVVAAMFLRHRRTTMRLVDEGNQRITDAIGNPLLTGINIGNGSIDIGMEGPGPMLLAGMFLGMFEKHPDAKNYIEVQMSSAKGDLVVTVQRREGKTPDALRREAEARLAVVEGELAAIRQLDHRSEAQGVAASPVGQGSEALGLHGDSK